MDRGAAGRTVVIVPCRRAWAGEFDVVSRLPSASLGALARRIDHIGSTSVPELPAKDVIDVQVIVATLQPTQRIVGAMARIEYALRANERARRAWAEFKLRLASRFPNDLTTYGELKDPATDLLIAAAEDWAAR